MRSYSGSEIKHFVSRPQFEKTSSLANKQVWPKISIVTPSYNQAEFLEKAMLSVLNQNYPNLEYIIIDGGSSDGSVEIIKKYEKFLHYWVSEPDTGQSAAINKGLRIASGDIIGWMNSDDIYLPNAFNACVKILAGKKDIDVIYGNAYRIDQSDEIMAEARYAPFFFTDALYIGVRIVNHAAFWKKEIMNQVGYLDESLEVMMDREYFLRIAKYGKKFKKIKHFLGAIRIHKESKENTIMKTLGSKTFLDIRQRYGIKVSPSLPWSKQYRFKKIYYLTKRIVLFLLQGDFIYLAKRILARIKK